MGSRGSHNSIRFGSVSVFLLCIGMALRKSPSSWQPPNSTLTKPADRKCVFSWSCHQKMELYFPDLGHVTHRYPEVGQEKGKLGLPKLHGLFMCMGLSHKENIFLKGIRDSWQAKAMPSQHEKVRSSHCGTVS